MTNPPSRNGLPIPSAAKGIRAPLFTAYADLRLDEEEISALTPPQQVELLHRLDYRRKYQLIRKSEDPKTLVGALSAEDLFFTLEAAGRGDSIDLLLHASPAQISHLIDLTCFDRERSHPEALLDWVAEMTQIDPERAFETLRDLEDERLVLMLGRMIRVRRFEWHDNREEFDEDALHTLDDYYQFEFVDPESPYNERITVFLGYFYRLDFERYMRIMETLIWELPSAVEELAWRARCDRMADLGYPEYLDALSILAYADPAELLKRADSATGGTKQVAKAAGWPAFFGRLFTEGSTFTRLLDDLPEEERETLRHELVFLGNRILVAHQALTDLDRLADGLTLLHAGLTVGLDYLSRGDDARARTLLRSWPLRDLFRAGYSLGLDLHRLALRLQDRRLTPAGPEAMEWCPSPWRDHLLALQRNPPMFVQLREGFPMPPRVFMRLEEIERTRAWLDDLDAWWTLVFVRLALDPKEILKSPYSPRLEPIEPERPHGRLAKILLTILVRAASGLSSAYEPIPAETLRHFIDHAFSLRPGDAALAADFAEWLRSFIDAARRESESAERERIERLIRSSLDELLSAVSARAPLASHLLI